MSSEQIKKNMDRYGVTEHEAQIMVERGRVYGEPRENHEHIANSITGLLQPWAHRIADGRPLPPHVVALILCALKMSRMRRVFHGDNYDDLAVYQKFARAWQREWDEEKKGSSDVCDHPIVSGMLVPFPCFPDTYLDSLYLAKDLISKEISELEAKGRSK